ncbi:MAG: 2-hydroxyacyl-CoA dehydratase family protein [Clostridiales Family XIII bacterium]|jgi:benzoyl-CoA reductase/2-hydroxyglutaryl-CoA dehydratase subunit BcrC/BadD/HgdB|nr:2-hydroxyacyl-CoA dehydratase family protein [Clostridiales Family XIII bacterium]
MEEKKSSKQILNELLAKHYADAKNAKEEGKPVVWSTSIAPQELLETMDVAVVYPENHAAAIGARKDASQFIASAESEGYSYDICSYARVNDGYANILYSEAENMPKPDMLFCCSNICMTVIKWYENIAKKFDIPVIFFDTPYSGSYQVDPSNVKFVEAQLEEAVTMLEGLTGRKFDYDRLKEVMQISNETASWWKKATDLAKNKPSPMNGFDMFNYMAPIVCFRGKESGRELFKIWYEELQERVEKGLGPWNDGTEEKYRVLWDGIACWPYLGVTYKVLKKHGINVVTSMYPESFALLYEQHTLAGMAEAYDSLYVLRNVDYAIDKYLNLSRDFQLDGGIFHSNRSCKGMAFKQFEIQRQMESQLGVPSVIFDGDQTDPSVFSEAQYETRVQALVEMMEARKGARR